LVYRLGSEKADHYFVLNDLPSLETTIDFGGMKYSKLTDAVTGEVLDQGKPFKVNSFDGRWIRAVK
jgi:hypothetical protein